MYKNFLKFKYTGGSVQTHFLEEKLICFLESPEGLWGALRALLELSYCGLLLRAFGPRLTHVSGLRPSNHILLLLHYGMDVSLGPSALEPH